MLQTALLFVSYFIWHGCITRGAFASQNITHTHTKRVLVQCSCICIGIMTRDVGQQLIWKRARAYRMMFVYMFSSIYSWGDYTYMKAGYIIRTQQYACSVYNNCVLHLDTHLTIGRLQGSSKNYYSSWHTFTYQNSNAVVCECKLLLICTYSNHVALRQHAYMLSRHPLSIRFGIIINWVSVVCTYAHDECVWGHM